MQSLHVIKIWDLNKKLHKTQTEYIYNVDNENISYRSPVCSPLYESHSRGHGELISTHWKKIL